MRNPKENAGKPARTQTLARRCGARSADIGNLKPQRTQKNLTRRRQDTESFWTGFSGLGIGLTLKSIETRFKGIENGSKHPVFRNLAPKFRNLALHGFGRGPSHPWRGKVFSGEAVDFFPEWHSWEGTTTWSHPMRKTVRRFPFPPSLAAIPALALALCVSGAHAQPPECPDDTCELPASGAATPQFCVLSPFPKSMSPPTPRARASTCSRERPSPSSAAASWPR